MQECSKIAEILSRYEGASGQKINLSKSEITFSKIVTAERRRDICSTLGVREVNRHEKYLGLPTIIGKSKKAIFAGLKEREWKKLRGWKEKLLARPGKETLIKGVAQAIPTYMMSVFKIPDGLLDEIHSMLARFWWGNGSETKMHRKSWEHLCLPKSMGGMGFRDLNIFNQALLAKQGWRLMHNDESLLHKILKAKYFKNTDLLNARRGFDPSYTWRSIWGAKALLLEGLKWRVGNGRDIRVWDDDWLPEGSSPLDSSSLAVVDHNLKVCNLIDDQCAEWNQEILINTFTPSEKKIILNTPLVRSLPKDVRYWWPNTTGVYTVKSGYWLGNLGRRQMEAGAAHNIWLSLWNLNGPPKLRHFLWRACHNVLAVNRVLYNRHMRNDCGCPICGCADETLTHSIFKCTATQKIWDSSMFPQLLLDAPSSSFGERFTWMTEKLTKDDLMVFATLSWAAWTSRNKVLFEASTHDPCVLAAGFIHYVDEYKSYASRVFGNWGIVNSQSASRWNPPPDGIIKLNVDEAVFSGNGVRLGVVLRNSSGRILATAVKK